MEKYKYSFCRDWFNYSDIKKKISNFLKKDDKHTILEIGCYEGLSSVFFADNFLNNIESTLTCVDPFLTIENNDHKEFFENNQEMNFDFNINNCSNKEKIKIHKITSDSFFVNNNKTYNLIYIDGSHELDYITRDIKNSYNCLEKGGIMWIDDYKGGGGINNDLQKTIDETLSTLTEPYEIIHSEYQLAVRKL